MPYTLIITELCERQLLALPVRDQRMIEAAIVSRLVHQPTVVTKAVKKLRPNPFAEYELRAGEYRVLYNVEENQVVLLIVGQKAGNKLIVEGEAFHGHQDHPPE